jgi:exonuclease SbcC
MKTLEDYITHETVPTQPLDLESPKTRTTVKSTEGFIIKEIEMKGFMRYLEKTSPPLSFPHKFTVITGKTGSGKTSILDAITFALYKRTSRTGIAKVKLTDICRPGGYVRISFVQNSEEYEVERGFTSSQSSYLTLKKNTKQIEGNIKELEKNIEDIIGLDYEGFRNSTFVKQEEMKKLGDEKGSDRLDIFKKLFRLETFEKAFNISQKRYYELTRRIDIMDAELSRDKEYAQKIPYLEDKLKNLANELKIREKDLENLKEALNKNKQVLQKLEVEHEDFLKVQIKFSNVEKRSMEIERKLKKSEMKVSEFKEWKAKAKALEEELREHESLQEESSGLKDLKIIAQRNKEKLKDLKEQGSQRKSEFEYEIKIMTSELSVQEKRIRLLSTEIDRDEAFGILRDEGRLEERIARIEMELAWLSEKEEFISTLTKEGERTKKALSRISQKASEINADSFVLTEIKSNIENIKKKMESKEEDNRIRLKEISDKMDGLQKKIQEIGFEEKDEKRLLNIEKTLKDMQKKKNELKRIGKKLEEIGDLSKYIEELEKQKTELHKDGIELKDKLNTLLNVEKEYQNIKQKMEELKNKEKNLSRDFGRIIGETGQLKEQISSLTDTVKRIKKTESKINELREKAEIYELLRNKVFHDKGIVMYAIDQLLPQLSLETSCNLSDMTDGRFSKVKLNSYQENNRYGIRIDVSGAEGKWHDVQEFSGGEKTQINAALRFAIAKELASMPQVGRTYGRMKTLFIDEGELGSLDTESSRQLFVAKLFDMGEFFEKIILITHLTEVAERFPGRILVYMTPEEESKIKVIA